LITNARWHLDIEPFDLQETRKRFIQFEIGSYVSWCGAVGFKIGPVDLLTCETNAIIHEVSDCPDCRNH